MTTPAAAGRVSRGTLLGQSRSGAKPLGNSPGAGPRSGPGSPGPGPGRTRRPSSSTSSSSPRTSTPTKQPRNGARASSGGSAGATPKGPSSTSPTSRSRSAGGSSATRQPKKPKKPSGGPFHFKTRASSPEYHNYQAIILAEFVAAEVLVAATPMATRKNQPGLSPYVPRDLVQLVAIGVVYMVLEAIATGGRGAGRLCAWIGALVLLTVGLNEASSLAKVFAFLTGGSGKPATDAETTAHATAAPTSIQQFSAAEPTLGTSDASGGPASSAGGGSGPRSGSAFVQEAGKFIGRPYVYGAAGPTSFDCSGLVQYALDKMGVQDVPRTSEEQWGWVQRIPESDLQAGDLIFEQWPGEASPGHVAIYAGGGQIIQAPAPGEDVQRVKWSPSIVHGEGGQIVGYGRVPGLNYSGTAGEGSAGKL